METENLHTDTRWITIRSTEEDWSSIAPVEHRQMLEQLLLIRKFEERLLDLVRQNLLHGPAHSSIGQEGAAVGCMSVLGSEDRINGTHRMHHQFLAKALNHVMANDYDPIAAPVPDAMQEVVMKTLAEIMGLQPGFCGGRGGSMHLKWDDCGVLGSNAIVGGNPPHAVGYALADKLLKRDSVSVSFFGDGAMQNGAAYESMNLAALYDLPAVFFCENNLYAVSTHLREQTRETRLSARGLGLGVPGVEVDGMDPVSVRVAMQWARNHIREQKGPVLIEALTYRYYHQSGYLPGSAFGYREKGEEQLWNDRDPLVVVPDRLVGMGVLSVDQVATMEQRVNGIIDAAVDALTVLEEGAKNRSIIDAMWPDEKSVEYGIRGDLSELAGSREATPAQFDSDDLSEMSYIEAVSLAARNAMAKDDRIIILGEDVHRLKGGTSGATKGVGEKYPERLLGTPICENGFTGMAVGAALNGLRPIVEIMYPDFALVAADQLFNQAAKVRHMFGGDHPLPLVVRSRVSAGTGYGSQHSMDASGLFALYPGWRIVAPSTPFDYIGLFNAAVRCDDPVLIVEYQNIFRNKGSVPADDPDYIIPFGSARVARSGSACTIVTYGGVVPMVEQAVDASGVDAEILDLRTLDPFGMDWDTIGASIRKTNRLLVAEQTTRGTSIGAHVVKGVQERFFDWLDAEVLHVSGAQSSPVISKVLEQAALADSADIEAGIRNLMAR